MRVQFYYRSSTLPQLKITLLKILSSSGFQLDKCNVILLDLHELHEDWLVRKTKFQPLAAPVTIIDANADLEILSEKYRSYGEELLQQAVEMTAVSNK